MKWLFVRVCYNVAQVVLFTVRKLESESKLSNKPQHKPQHAYSNLTLLITRLPSPHQPTNHYYLPTPSTTTMAITISSYHHCHQPTYLPTPSPTTITATNTTFLLPLPATYQPHLPRPPPSLLPTNPVTSSKFNPERRHLIFQPLSSLLSLPPRSSFSNTKIE